MPQLTTLVSSAALEDVLAALDRDGAVIVRVPDGAGLAGRIADEIAPYVAATLPGRDGFTGTRTTRTGALAARSRAVREAVMNPLVRAVADKILLPNCQRVQLHLTQAIRIMPGQTAQPIHKDRWAWGPYLKDIEPQLNTIWAVTRFTKENGATQVIPGSHQWADGREAGPHEIAYAEMEPGSVLIYTGTVLHGGGANVSGEDRIGLNLTYALGWLRQEENQYLSCPPAIAATLEPELQALLGYAMGSYALGYYTPPLPPGEGPEIVPPEHALKAAYGEAGFGAGALLAQSSALLRADAQA
jgi:hypothetical protein